MFLTAEAAAFFAAWQGLRTDAAFPHYRDAFQRLPSHMIPRLMVLEEGPDGQYVVRFLGTECAQAFGQDITGQDSLRFLAPKVALAARHNMKTMIDHPCGMHHVAHYATNLGPEMKLENVTLPIANDDGLPKRMINFLQQTGAKFGKALGEVMTVSERTWIDAGFGVPAKSPKK